MKESPRAAQAARGDLKSQGKTQKGRTGLQKGSGGPDAHRCGGDGDDGNAEGIGQPRRGRGNEMALLPGNGELRGQTQSLQSHRQRHSSRGDQPGRGRKSPHRTHSRHRLPRRAGSGKRRRHGPERRQGLRHTGRPGGGLPDGRAYEQASPTDKNGEDAEGQFGLVKAAVAGNAISFFSTFGIPGGKGAQELPSYVALRGEGEAGWAGARQPEEESAGRAVEPNRKKSPSQRANRWPADAKWPNGKPWAALA